MLKIEVNEITKDKIFFIKTDNIKNDSNSTVLFINNKETIGKVDYITFKKNLKLKDNDTYFIPSFILEKVIEKKKNPIHPFLISTKFKEINNDKVEQLIHLIECSKKDIEPSKNTLEILNQEKNSLNEYECCELCKAFSIILNVVNESEELEELFFDSIRKIIKKQLENIEITDEIFLSFATSIKQKINKNISIPFDLNNENRYLQVDIKNKVSIINNNNILIWKGILYIPFKTWVEEIYFDYIRKQKHNFETVEFDNIKNRLSNLLPKKEVYKNYNINIPEQIPSIEEALKNDLFPPCVQSWINQLKKIGCTDKVRRTARTFFDLGYTSDQIETFFRSNGATDKNIKEIFAWTKKIEQDSEILNKRNGIYNKSCGKRCEKLINDSKSGIDFGKGGTHYTCPLIKKESLREFYDIEDLGEKLKNIKEENMDLCCFYFNSKNGNKTNIIKSPTDFFIKRLNFYAPK